MILSICAKKRCGKNTVAKFIDTYYQGNVVQYALAAPLKDSLYHAYDLWGRSFRNGICDNHFLSDGNETGVDRDASLCLTKGDIRFIFDRAWTFIVNKDPSLSRYSSKISTYIRHYSETVEPSEWSIRKIMQVFGTDICVAVYEKIWLKFMMSVYLDAICDNMVFVVTDCRMPHEYSALRGLGSKMIFVYRKGYSDSESDTHYSERGLTPRVDDYLLMNNTTVADLEKQTIEILGKFK